MGSIAIKAGMGGGVPNLASGYGNMPANSFNPSTSPVQNPIIPTTTYAPPPPPPPALPQTSPLSPIQTSAPIKTKPLPPQ